VLFLVVAVVAALVAAVATATADPDPGPADGAATSTSTPTSTTPTSTTTPSTIGGVGPPVKALVATPLDASVFENGTRWDLSNSCGTDNGLPTGGASDGSPGFALLEATTPAAGDAFDCGGMVWVGNSVVADDDGTVDVSPSGADTVVTPSTVTLAGLQVHETYRVFASGDTVRVLVELQNPTAAAISTTVSYVDNFGSDVDTRVVGSSSGDTTFTTADRWIVDSDGPVSGDKLVNTTVLAGPGAAVTPNSVSETVFSAAGTEGAIATFPVTVPPGATRAFMFFQVVGGGGNGTPNSALVASAAVWNSPIPASSPLLAGISSDELGEIVNWSLAPVAAIAAPAAAVGVVPTFTG
jgi:hypothetical protein